MSNTGEIEGLREAQALFEANLIRGYSVSFSADGAEVGIVPPGAFDDAYTVRVSDVIAADKDVATRRERRRQAGLKAWATRRARGAGPRMEG